MSDTTPTSALVITTTPSSSILVATSSSRQQSSSSSLSSGPPITSTANAFAASAISIVSGPGWRSLNLIARDCLISLSDVNGLTYPATVRSYANLVEYVAHPPGTTNKPCDSGSSSLNSCFCRFGGPTAITVKRNSATYLGSKDFESALDWLSNCGKERCDAVGIRDLQRDCEKQVPVYASYCVTALSVSGAQDNPVFVTLPPQSDGAFSGGTALALVIALPVVSSLLFLGCGIWCCCRRARRDRSSRREDTDGAAAATEIELTSTTRHQSSSNADLPAYRVREGPVGESPPAYR